MVVFKLVGARHMGEISAVTFYSRKSARAAEIYVQVLDSAAILAYLLHIILYPSLFLAQEHNNFVHITVICST